MEYFIIDEGEMWNKILEVLEEKAKSGVDVRIMYDDVGSFLLLSPNYPKVLEKKGIKCCVFNKFKPFFIISHNNRDHRKITVIDGKVAFTGGINLADEYINKYEKHGYWKEYKKEERKFWENVSHKNTKKKRLRQIAKCSQ